MAYPSPPRSLSVVGWSVCGIADHSDLPDWSAKPYFAGLLITLWPDSIYRTLCGTRLMPSAISRSFLSPGNPLVDRNLLSKPGCIGIFEFNVSSLSWGGWDGQERVRPLRGVISSVQSDPDDLVVHQGYSMKTMTRCSSVDLCHSEFLQEWELMALGSN